MILDIENFFKNLKSKKIIFVGLGNVYRGDDGIGCYIIEGLQKKISLGNIYFFNVGVIIENYINKIIKLNSEAIIFTDAIRNKDFASEFCIFTKEEIKNYTFSTHNISLYTIVEYIQTQQYIKYRTKPEVYVLGVKTDSLDFVEILSEKTKNIADKIIKVVYSSLI